MNLRADTQRMLQGLRMHPEYIIAELKKAYPGITDGEASALASRFTGLIDGSGNRKEWQQRADEYRAAVEAVTAKYPGGMDADIDIGFDLGVDFDIDL